MKRAALVGLILVGSACSSSAGESTPATTATTAAGGYPAGHETKEISWDGESMNPTLTDGSLLRVDVDAYRSKPPRYGDVIIFNGGASSTRELIKRVVAVGGDTIAMAGCVVTLNGNVLAEPYLDTTIVTPDNCGPNFSPVTLAADHFFVMGDNRPGSGDSRGALGPVDISQVEGRVVEQKLTSLGDWAAVG